MHSSFDFELPIIELQSQISQLLSYKEQQIHLAQGNKGGGEPTDYEETNVLLESLYDQMNQLVEKIFGSLTPWQKVQLARHTLRPHAKDYIESLFPDFMELHGDRRFGDDAAIMSGVASWPPLGCEALEYHGPVMVIGQQKGRSTKAKLLTQFGMPKPEGYRKAMRAMRMAERFCMPVITLIDTPGAYPGLEAEQRGQAEAIAQSIQTCLQLKVPIISVVIGEGGSGGALAMAAADRVLMQQYSIYSVISPESCSSILWNSREHAAEMAQQLHITADDLKAFKIIDAIIPEPMGGAHKDFVAASKLLGMGIVEHMDSVMQSQKSASDGVMHRYKKYRSIGEGFFTQLA